MLEKVMKLILGGSVLLLVGCSTSKNAVSKSSEGTNNEKQELSHAEKLKKAEKRAIQMTLKNPPKDYTKKAENKKSSRE